MSGFRFDTTPVLKPEEIKPEQVNPDDIMQARIIEKDGHLFRLNNTEELVRFNTGIVIGYKIEHALDLIDRGHRELPIQADYVGKDVQTTDTEIVKVMLKDYDEDEQVIVVENE